MICRFCGRDINAIGQDNMSRSGRPICEDCDEGDEYAFGQDLDQPDRTVEILSRATPPFSSEPWARQEWESSLPNVDYTPTTDEVPDAAVEIVARAFFSQTRESSSGFHWPINGQWGRDRDMERARNVLVRALAAIRAAKDGAQ